MNSDMKTYFIAWILLTGVILLLAVYRWLQAKKQYTVLHLRESEVGMIPEQVTYAHTLNVIDRLGEALTAIAFISGVAMIVAYVYSRMD